MSDSRMYKILAVLTCFILIATACSPSAEQESAISTAVALTIQAGELTAQAEESEALTEVALVSTLTPELVSEATPAPAVTPTSGPTLVSAPSDPNCIGAELVSEYPPDETVYKPGTFYWKTWTIKNVGTCTWDSSYKLIFWSGDLMGGLVSYPLPEQVIPGNQTGITIYLQAPETEGTYTGYWRLQTPWNANFGVGPYSQAIFAQILVTKKPGKEIGITDISYEVVRDPLTGCPRNVRYTVNATITVNGPFDFIYFWNQSDFNESGEKEMIFKEAGSRTISRSWLVGRGATQNPRWMKIVVTFPEHQGFGFDRAWILNNCP